MTAHLVWTAVSLADSSASLPCSFTSPGVAVLWYTLRWPSCALSTPLFTVSAVLCAASVMGLHRTRTIKFRSWLDCEKQPLRCPCGASACLPCQRVGTRALVVSVLGTAQEVADGALDLVVGALGAVGGIIGCAPGVLASPVQGVLCAIADAPLVLSASRGCHPAGQTAGSIWFARIAHHAQATVGLATGQRSAWQGAFRACFQKRGGCGGCTWSQCTC